MRKKKKQIVVPLNLKETLKFFEQLNNGHLNSVKWNYTVIRMYRMPIQIQLAELNEEKGKN